MLISQLSELADGDPASVLVQLRGRHDGARVALDVLREPFGDGHVINLTVADGGH